MSDAADRLDYISDRPEAGLAGRADRASVVQAELRVGDADLNYCHAKLAFDGLVEPANAIDAVPGQLDRMANDIRRMSGSESPDATFAALRRYVHDAGPWNDQRPFVYDQSDPLGQSIGNKLLANYLTTRRGNCVSMPALLLILAEQLGLEMALARAPLHIFLRYRGENGQLHNIEATSGGHPARDEWYRDNMRMSDRALANGVYMRTLSRREGVALLATTVLEHLLDECRFNEALAVAEAILRHAPRDAYTMVKYGTACGALLEAEFTRQYRIPALIPAHLRRRYLWLAERNARAFAAAEALGWEPGE